MSENMGAELGRRPYSKPELKPGAEPPPYEVIKVLIDQRDKEREEARKQEQAPAQPPPPSGIVKTAETIATVAGAALAAKEVADQVRGAVDTVKSLVSGERGEPKAPGSESAPPPPPPPESPPPPPNPEPRENFSGLSAKELQIRIVKSQDAKELADLRREKEIRIEELRTGFETKGTGGITDFNLAIETRIKDVLKAATPATYQLSLEELKEYSGLPNDVGDPRLNGLAKIVFIDEVDQVLHQIYLGADSVDPPINKADKSAADSLKAFLDKSRIEIGVRITNPIDLLSNMPASFKQWTEQNPWVRPTGDPRNSDDNLFNSAQAYYSLLDSQRELQEAMMKRGGFEYLQNPPPKELVAIFREGRYGPWENQWKDKVRFLSIKDPKDRWLFIAANMAAFNSEIIQTSNWKGLIDNWLGEVSDCALLARLSPEDMERVDEMKLMLRSMMAVSASARAMEESGGAASTYLEHLTLEPGKGGNLDRQDSWAAFLLHKDPEKYWRVIHQPLIGHYYKRVLDDMGIGVLFEPGQVRSKIINEEGKPPREVMGFHEDAGEFKLNLEQAKKSKVVEYLRQKGAGKYKGGFEEYIKYLMATDDPEFVAKCEADEKQEKREDWLIRTGAARMACDLILVDKWTNFECELTNAKDYAKPSWKDEYLLKPSEGWGGDPLRLVKQPSFLTRIIKQAYKDFPEVLDMVDLAFQPNDIWPQTKGLTSIPVSIVGHMKDYGRWHQALAAFLGDSRGGGIPNISIRDLQEKLDGVVFDKLDTVYGAKSGEDRKEVLGAIMARILRVKALAATMETVPLGFKQALRYVVADQKEIEDSPYRQALKEIWGRNYDSEEGLLRKWASGRTGAIFGDNKFGAEADLDHAYRMLLNNDQHGSRGKAVALEMSRAFIKAAQTTSDVFGRK